MLEQIEVVGDAGSGHGEGLGDLIHIQVALFQHFEDPTTGGIAQGFEEKVQCLYN